MKPLVINKVIALILFIVFISLRASAQITSNFSSNDEGWKAYDGYSATTSAVTYNATGGNPNGDISFATSAGYTQIYFQAPSRFIGNQSRAYNQNLTFDMEVSNAGTDNSYGDIILSSSYGTLIYQLPTKPSTLWTSYSVQLNEANWHNGCSTCAAPNQVLMKQVLSNVTNLQIRNKYLSTFTTGGTYTSQLDNVVLNTIAIGTAPSIISFTPTAALAGATVTITGANFNTTLSQNAVYFNGIKATVTSASATQLTVTVPTSAAYGAITAVNLGNNLQGTSAISFNPLFDNNKDYGGRILTSSMAMGYSTVLPTNNAASNGFGNMDKGDLDGDGWIDFVATETSSAKTYAFQNLGTGGTVSVSSFSSAITLPSLSSIPGGSPGLSEVIVVDVDSDGLLDIAASTSGGYSYSVGYLAVYRNTSTVGTISFASPVFFAYNYYSALSMATGDLDGDGRTDFAFTTGTSPGNVFICQNQSMPGNIDFSFGASISSTNTSGYSDIVIGDLTGDGKPEIVCPGYNNTVLSIYQNNSTAGTISMSSPFTIPALVSYTVQLAMADLDADNKQDMVWSVYGSNYVYFTKNLYAGGTFNASSFGAAFQVTNTLSNPLGISVGDINADGQPDVIMSGYNDLAILQNVGTAGNLSASSFTPTVLFQGSTPAGTMIGARSPVVADVDGDNKPEAAFVSSNAGLAAGAAGVYVFHNESFQPPQITTLSTSSAPSNSIITVTGNYLYTHYTTPQVFGEGLVTAPSNVSNTSLQINVPTGLDDNRVSVTTHGLQAFSPTQLYTQLNGGFGGAINASTFGASVDYALSSYAANPGLAVADLDNDGKPDIVIDDNGTSKIYANTLSSIGTNVTSGSFTLQTNTLTGASHLKVTDLDGDGIKDVVTNNYFFAGKGISPNPISFANFSYTPIGNANYILVNHDFNLDGKPEVVISNSSNQIMVYENFTNKGAPFVYSGSLASLNTPLTYAQGGGMVQLAAADFDGDGFEDIAYGVNSTTSTLNILLNSGSKQVMTSSQFAGPTTFAALTNPQYITVADFNADGKMDIAVGYYSTSLFISVFVNASTVGNLNFTRQDFAVPAYCNGIEAGDIDGDGNPEIVTINNPSGSNGSFSILRNTSTGGTLSFATTVTYSLGTTVPKILSLADVNLDNKTDIVISRTGGTSATLSIFQNFISFPTISVSPQPISTYSVCVGATSVISTGATGTTNITYQWQEYVPDGGGYGNLNDNMLGISNSATSALTINTTNATGGGTTNLGTTTYRCKISGDFATPVYTNTVSYKINSLPTAPIAQDASNCGQGSVTLTASGASNGNYVWYDENGLITGQNNSSYSTPVISSTTPYSVAITNGACVSAKTNVNAIINTIPNAPTTQGANACANSSFTLTASGATDGQYRWYTAQTSGTAIAGEVNSTYTTPTLSTTTTYYVSVNNGTCESARAAVTANVVSTGCNPPTINTAPLATQVGGVITLNLVPLITTSNNNLDLSSLQIVVPPSSGATASIDANGILTIDYTGLAFAGNDRITIRACDLNGNCAEQQFTISVSGDIEVFNGISPNGVNPKLIIQNIEILPDTKINTVSIYDRWENLVWQGNDYDNSSVVFTGTSNSGSALPSGVYFYKIVFASGRGSQTGFIALRRQ